jgi:GDP-4-dehydro-6-deoxy-D-mannose reductase
VVEALVSIAAVTIDVLPDPERQRPSDIPTCVGDPRRVQHETSWRPTTALETSLADALGWWRERRRRAG